MGKLDAYMEKVAEPMSSAVAVSKRLNTAIQSAREGIALALGGRLVQIDVSKRGTKDSPAHVVMDRATILLRLEKTKGGSVPVPKEVCVVGCD